MKNAIKNQSGMSALLTVVIISAASLIMARSMAFLSLTELEMGDKAARGDISLFAADACFEEALNQIRLDNNFSANDRVLESNGLTCRFSAAQSGSGYEIEAVAEIDGFEQSIQAEAGIIDGRLDIISYIIGGNQ